MKIRVVCESTADLPKSYIEEKRITIVPLLINLGEETKIDGVDVDANAIYSFVKEKNEIPKTAARSIFEYQEVFENLRKECDAIIYVGFSSELSSSFSNASVAAQDFENVYCVDSKSLSSGHGLLVMTAIEEIEKGKKPEEIIEILEKTRNKIQASFVVDTMKYLRMGGRCSALAAFGATLLKIKPSLYLSEGKICVGKKYMGRISDSADKYIDDILKANPNPKKDKIFLTYSSFTSFDLDIIDKKLTNCGFEKIIHQQASSTISSHCGPETLGILFINN